MSFTTFDELEVINPLKSALGQAPNSREYIGFFLNLNIHYFLIEFTRTIDGEKNNLWEKVILGNISDALNFIERKDLDAIKINLLSRRCDNDDGELHINTINEILVGYDKNKELVYIYICTNGNEYIDSNSETLKDDLINIKSIYTL